MSINIQSIAVTLHNDLYREGIFTDKEEIASRLADLQFYGKAANKFDYIDYYYEHYYPCKTLNRVLECSSPYTITDSIEHSANDCEY